MLARIRKSLDENEKGFTLVELLVVVIIIGILAAIAIPAFLRQRENAWGAQVVAAMKNATTAAESYAVENNGSYTGLAGTAMAADGTLMTEWEDAGLTATGDVAIVATVDPSGNSYELSGTHAQRGTDTWTYDSTVGEIVTP